MSAGVLYVHSCPPVLCPHVEWAVAAELGTRARIDEATLNLDPAAVEAASRIGRRTFSGSISGKLRAHVA